MKTINFRPSNNQPSKTGLTRDAEQRLEELRRKKALKGEEPSVREQLMAIDPSGKDAFQFDAVMAAKRKARRNEEIEESVLREQKLKESMASVKLRKEIEEAKRRGKR